MPQYQHLEAYQLTRTLLVGIYEATPAEPEDGLAHRLRCAAVTAASSLMGAASSPGDCDLEVSRKPPPEQLASARQALDQVATTLVEYHRSGALSEYWYEALHARQSRAAEALSSLA